MRSRGWVTVLVAVLGMIGFGVAPAAARADASADFTQVGQLALYGAGEDLTGSAISGSTVFTGSPDATFQDVNQGAIFAYTEPSGGWTGTPPVTATLVASDPRPEDNLGTVIRADGPTVATGADQPSGSGEIRVFSEPSGGWLGTVNQSATLVAPHVRLFSPTLSGNTIVALGQITSDPGDAAIYLQTYLFVFTEPAGGWSGLQGPSAVLTPPAEASISDSGSSVAIGPNEIVAGSGPADAVFVFDEPSGGWSGTVTPAATLTAPGTYIDDQLGWSVLLVGSAVVAGEADPKTGQLHNSAGAFVFDEPADGWVSEGPSARLIDANASLVFPAAANFGSDGLALVGSTVFVPVDLTMTASRSASAGPGAVDAYTLPSAGVSGTVDPTATLVGAGAPDLGGGLSADGSTLFVSDAAPSGSIAQAPSDLHSSDQITDGPVAGDGLLASNADTYVFPDAGQLTGTVSASATLLPGVRGEADGGQSIFSEPAGGWASAVPSATLLPPVPAFTGSPDAANADGSDVTVGWSTSSAAPADAFPTLVYPETASGWSFTQAPPARLLEPSGWSLRDATAGDGSAVALAVGQPVSSHDPPPERIEIYAEPAGGWSGLVEPSSYVDVPDNTFIYGLWLHGNLLVTQEGDDYQVYTEPAGGWGDGLGTPATLATGPADGAAPEVSFDGNAIVMGAMAGGRTVAADTTEPTEVFTRPSGGWRGRIAPAATLKVPYSGGWLFQEPAAGWRGTLRPSAGLAAGSIAALSADGHSLIVNTAATTARETPDAEFVPLGEPATGWRGMLSISSTAAPLTYEPGASAQLIGSHLFVAGNASTDPGALGSTTAYDPETGQPISVSDGQSDVDPTAADPGNAEQGAVDIYATGTVPVAGVVSVGAPRLSAAKLTGGQTGHPTVKLTVAAGQNADALSAVTLTLPAGLSFVRTKSQLSRALPLCRALGVLCSSPRADQLLVTLEPNLSRRTNLTVSIPAAAIRETTTLERRLAAVVSYDRIRAHRHTRTASLSLTAGIVDVLGTTTARTAHFSVH